MCKKMGDTRGSSSSTGGAILFDAVAMVVELGEKSGELVDVVADCIGEEIFEYPMEHLWKSQQVFR